MPQEPAAEVTALLQAMIRSACVNDGTPESGHETRNAAILRDLFEGTGLAVQSFEPSPGRESIVTRIEGSDPSAPSLLLMGHTDVVPVSSQSWHRDPFGGELVEGWIWGRGAIDMLNLTASMAVAMARLQRANWRPRGTLIYLGVADEEAGGEYGAAWLDANHPDVIAADYVLTECGGIPFRAPGGMRIWTTVAEKGVSWRRITARGVPEHASRPLYTQNALLVAAEVINRLASFRPRAVMTEPWLRFVDAMGFDAQLAGVLTDPDHVWEGIAELPPTLGKVAHACTHISAAPTVIHGGSKTNVIPDKVVLEVDIRKLPGQGSEETERFLDQALGDLRAAVEIEPIQEQPASASAAEGPLWQAMVRAASKFWPEATLLPAILTGSTDARFFRNRGIPSFGFGMFSEKMSLELWNSMFHANDERVDVDSLVQSVELWQMIAKDLLG